MVTIKGPRSALTDFIKEHGLNEIRPNTTEKEKEDKKTITPKQKKVKKIITQQPIELINLTENQFDIANEQKYIELYNIINDKNETNTKLDDLIGDIDLDLFSKYLSQTRRINFKIFEFIVNNSSNQINIYDCSQIKNDEYAILFSKIEQLEELSLYFCGQLTNEMCNYLLQNTKNLKNWFSTARIY
ncbi:hypothetical protein EDEG_02409 [Edhazardia aedis USNM 41457]|uniref:Uncharacterized protein n=1 Tax=Edhazardia aedis (strain USNM 41457) TaxID=1003232 RepID=J9D630_EDHAE|nr:hypothetical protein EDEG_02409 [Edhazardia aedis USNM 41457]|eukprot:EJW03241.1 hypothetical protein EDEG_02409 [Edhazardia aedis USNM 41457]